jgi:hypothetical protein
VGRRRFDDFLCGKGKKDRHPDIVDDEACVLREAEVDVRRGVRPYQRRDRTDRKQQ